MTQPLRYTTVALRFFWAFSSVLAALGAYYLVRRIWQDPATQWVEVGVPVMSLVATLLLVTWLVPKRVLQQKTPEEEDRAAAEQVASVAGIFLSLCALFAIINVVGTVIRLRKGAGWGRWEVDVGLAMGALALAPVYLHARRYLREHPRPAGALPASQPGAAPASATSDQDAAIGCWLFIGAIIMEWTVLTCRSDGWSRMVPIAAMIFLMGLCHATSRLGYRVQGCTSMFINPLLIVNWNHLVFDVPHPRVIVAPTAVHLPSVAPGNLSRCQVQFTNGGNGTLAITLSRPPSPFRATFGEGKLNIGAGQRQRVTVRVKPPLGTPPGRVSADWVITSNDEKRPVVHIPLVATVQ